jgi:hypothetical protein
MEWGTVRACSGAIRCNPKETGKQGTLGPRRAVPIGYLGEPIIDRSFATPKTSPIGRGSEVGMYSRLTTICRFAITPT